MKRIVFVIMALMISLPSLSAQSGHELYIKVRASFQHDQERTGFVGEYFTVNGKGDIGAGFSYDFRHNINRRIERSDIFSATDWVFLNYSPDGKWQFRAGKIVADVGSIEYDAAAVDLYYTSEYWINSGGVFNFGVSAAYQWEKDLLRFQFMRSPASNWEDRLFSYNLGWYGRHGCWKSIYSLNLFGMEGGSYMGQLALGNLFTPGRAAITLDAISRSDMGDIRPFGSYSLVGEFKWNFSEKLDAFVRGSRDRNRGFARDFFVFDGTSCNKLGGGVEFRPIPTVRLHAYYYKRWGDIAGRISDLDVFNIGATWQINILKKK